MIDEDFFIEDLNVERKKKINSSGKGKRGERDLVKILNERFIGHEPFSRVVGSGNRWGQTPLTKAAKSVMSSDLVVPAGFNFAIECKYGYSDIDFCNAFDNGNKQLDEFIKQAETDAKRCERKPMLCWKKPRKDWLCFIKENIPATYKMSYRDWNVFSLTTVLSMEDSFFFN